MKENYNLYCYIYINLYKLEETYLLKIFKILACSTVARSPL
jgi:hypothetical protein